ncbi:hypothetical protein D3867_37110 (plasmid) [Azospirillum argentinense]|uniref:Uncharacterized protein n=2 Tax=Azospirillum TaxID=191 RepID=A0A4D8QD01_AZOBR|nr:hypothetical protein D3867_37110 [Azospirillum argentinense]
MQAAGLDRHALARASGADAAALSRLFSGMADDLPAPDLDRMVIFFGVPPEVLLHGEEVATGANTLRTILAPATAPTTTGLALVPWPPCAQRPQPAAGGVSPRRQARTIWPCRLQ